MAGRQRGWHAAPSASRLSSCWQRSTCERPSQSCGHVEYAGVIAKLEGLAAKATDRDLLVVESRNASDTHVLALPLAYIYARNVLVLNSPRPDKTRCGRVS